MQHQRQSNDYHRAIDLNNRGVSFIENCQYDQAVSSLIEGMEIVKRGLASDKEESCDQMDDDAAVTAGPCALHNSECDFLETQAPDFLKNRGVGEQRYVFRYPIRARPCSTGGFVKLSIISLYNLALSFHLSALKSLNNGRLSKALLLYECTFQVQVEEGIELSFVHPLAILNNVGQIHALLDHKEQAAMTFNNLLSTMLCIVDQSIGCSDEAVETWDGFLSNVLELIIMNPSPAAAA